MKKPFRIRMLQSAAGRDFALSAGDITDKFSHKEAKRLIDAGMAEVAPPEPVKKPETKQEWDDERDKLLEENARLKEENDAALARIEALDHQVTAFNTFKATMMTALGDGHQETAVAPAAPEKRG